LSDLDLRQLAVAEAIRRGIDPHLILRQFDAESGGDPGAVSPKGAVGAMQLMPGTARDMGVDPNDPADNVRGGVAYMGQQLDRFGSPQLAAAAYNAGPGRVERAGGVPDIPETQAYVAKVAPGDADAAPDHYDADVFGSNGPAAAKPADHLDTDVFGDAATAQPAVTYFAGPKGERMATWTNPDGSQEIGAASDAPGATAAPGQASAPATPAAPALKDDFGLGVKTGLNRPFDNAAMALEFGLGKLGIPVDKIDQALGMPSAADVADQHAAEVDQAAAAGRKPSAWGEAAGGTVAALPTFLLPGGPLANGALNGALNTSHRDVGGVAGDAAFGAAAGKAVDTALGAVKTVVAPPLQKWTGDLAKRGITLTPGDLIGGTARRIEDKLTSVPILGDAIQSARANSVLQFNRAAVGDALAPIGEKLPASVDTGHDAVAYAGKVLGDKYESIVPRLKVEMDRPFADNLTNLRDLATNLEGDQARLFDGWTKKVVGSFSGAGKMTGRSWKTLDTELGQEYSLYRRSPAPADQKYASALLQLQSELRDMVERSNPVEAKTLKALNQGYANLRRVEGAATQANEGIFTAPQLRTASRVQDSSLYKRQTARGQAPMQDLAEAAQKILGNRTPDSGTAGRLLQATPQGAVAAALGLPLKPLYSPQAVAIATRILASPRPAGAQAIADILARSKTPLVAAGSAATVRARNPGP
jgi:hypothetical protein